MKIQELLSDSSKWTQGENARDAEGKSVDRGDPKAVCWCILGAMELCYGHGTEDFHKAYGRVVSQLCVNGYSGLVSKFNDTHSYEDVMIIVRTLDL